MSMKMAKDIHDLKIQVSELEKTVESLKAKVADLENPGKFKPGAEMPDSLKKRGARR